MTSNPSPAANERWTFIRDVVVFQIKLLLDNLRDLVLMPVALAAAVIDLLYRGEREGALFYKVLRWGLHSEEVIDVYSAIAHHDPGRFKVSEAYTVDGVIARLENVVTREVEKGGTAATIKTAMDRAIDQLHWETGSARDAVVRTAGKLRGRLGREEEGS
ncbi:MAG: hypothetical protein ACJ8NS_15810 [Chthoniobacterales bacterium]